MISVFIDGANLHATLRAMKKDINFKKLKEGFGEEQTVRIHYYSAVLPNGEISTIRPLLDWLAYNGFTVVIKEAKRYIDELTGLTKIKGNMDIEMAVDMLQASDFSEDIWLFSGDGDFTYAVDRLKQRGCKVTVLSTLTTDPVFIADELRRAADTFIDLADLPTKFKDIYNSKPRWS